MLDAKKYTGADDANGNHIFEEDEVMFRDHKWKVRWNKEMLCYYLDDVDTKGKIAFNIYVASECELVTH